MKKLFIICILSFSITYSLFAQTETDTTKVKGIPQELKEYINVEKEPIEYKQVITSKNLFGKSKKCPKFLTKEQALEDIEMLQYLFDTAYSGREYWENHGVDFNGMYENLRKFVENCDDGVATEELEKIIVQSLQEITDGHLNIDGAKHHRFFKHKTAYFSDLLLEKRGDNFVVIDSKIKSVPKGNIFTDEEKYLFLTLSAKGKKDFLIGTLSYEKITSIKLKFDGKIKEIPIHKCKMGHNDLLLDEMLKKPFFVKKKNDVPILRVTDFYSNYKDLKQFENYAYKLKNSNRFIFSLYNNNGGSSNYPENFIKNLNGYCHFMQEVELSSPSTKQFWANLDIDKIEIDFVNKIILDAREKVKEYKKEPLREWLYESNPQDNSEQSNKEDGKYQGLIIVLANRGTASSGEVAVFYAKSIKNNIFIGENTGGVGRFGEMLSYYLPNSNILLQLPSKIFFYPGYDCPEGVGFMPDYWLDLSRPVKEVVRWLMNPDTYQYKLK
ncbi:MAG: hypothetical protein KAW92_02025 [Candidatus Cloacimonetes bacterium]|nr:hypothetical protein [Candidatus Cloacimonadota bacterium]